MRIESEKRGEIETPQLKIWCRLHPEKTKTGQKIGEKKIWSRKIVLEDSRVDVYVKSGQSEIKTEFLPQLSAWFWPTHSLVSIGSYDSSGLDKVHESLWSLCNRFDLIEAGPINNAIQDIPNQRNKWSCGINSAGRFMAMVGHPHRDFRSFHNHSPNHSMGHLETGPGTQRLVYHMKATNCFGNLHVGSNMTDQWELQRDLINRSIALSRPAMVLVEVASRRLHWINIIGRGRDAPHNYLILDTNGKIYEYPGGEDTLRQRMDLGSHIIHSVPLRDDRVARFNSITATNGHLPDNRCCRRNTANSDENGLRGNRHAAHNIVNTVLDSPNLLARPAAPFYFIRKIF